MKFLAYGAALILLAAGAFGLGSAVGPVNRTAEHGGEDGTRALAEHGERSESGTHSHSPGAEGTGPTTAGSSHEPAGLAVSSGGYTLSVAEPIIPANEERSFTFRVIGPDGRPVTAFAESHEKLMHLIVLRRDATQYQHLHPEMDPDGTWRVPLRLSAPGSYRAFADFVPKNGHATTLGVDLAVPGEFVPVSHQPSRVASVDGYQVELTGELVAGRSSPVSLSISKDGVPVTDLAPYLGAFGHLVAVREGDLAYLHVHPNGASSGGHDTAGPRIDFLIEVPTEGSYRLFLDFAHNDAVHTAQFTVPINRAATG